VFALTVLLSLCSSPTTSSVLLSFSDDESETPRLFFRFAVINTSASHPRKVMADFRALSRSTPLLDHRTSEKTFTALIFSRFPPSALFFTPPLARENTTADDVDAVVWGTKSPNDVDLFILLSTYIYKASPPQNRVRTLKTREEGARCVVLPNHRVDYMYIYICYISQSKCYSAWEGKQIAYVIYLFQKLCARKVSASGTPKQVGPKKINGSWSLFLMFFFFFSAAVISSPPSLVFFFVSASLSSREF